MARVEEVKVPDIGDFDAVDVIEVLVSAGARVAVEDSLITLESDKATMDVPSPVAGRVVEVKLRVGDKVAEGGVIATIEVADEAAPSEDAVDDERPPAEPEPAAPSTSEPPKREGEAQERAAEPPPGPEVREFASAYASPAVRRYARELGVDLTRVRGTGRKGRILRDDVQAWVKEALARPEAGGGALLPEMPRIDFSRFGEIERQPLTRVQKIAGPNLHRSWLHVPHVTQNDEADITDLEEFRQAHKDEAEAKGFKLTPLAFLMKAAVAALRQYPIVNSSVDPDGEHLILKRYYHLGIAVDTPQGLMVPVVRDVDRKSLIDLAGELASISEAARAGKLTPDQIRGASFTISSLGGIGGGHFTPIVNAPEVAILGVGRSRLQPVWNGASFEPRLILPISLSYDHRVVDGALGVRFTSYLARVLSDLRRLLL